MTYDLTLIKTSVLTELLEKALIYDAENTQDFVNKSWAEINKDIMIRKENFLSDYINVPINLDKEVIDKLEEEYKYD